MTITAKAAAIVIGIATPLTGNGHVSREIICYKIEDIPLRYAGQCIANARFINHRSSCMTCIRINYGAMGK